MKALSIRQPWAWLVAAGYKDIENRTWPTEVRARIYIHAARRPDRVFSLVSAGREQPFATKSLFHSLPAAAQETVLHLERHWRQGAIIGEADIVDCVGHSGSRWFVGPWGFVLRSPTLYDTPIPCRGRLGFFQPAIQSRK